MHNEAEEQPPPPATEPPARTEADLPWYLAQIRREQDVMKGAPCAFALCVLICSVLLGAASYWFFDKLYAAEISAKNATIETLKTQIDSGRPATIPVVSKSEHPQVEKILSGAMPDTPSATGGKTDFEKDMIPLRKEHNVRQLSVLESDRSLSEMPKGTFGYMSAQSLGYCLADARGYTSMRVARLNLFDEGFEIHRIENNSFLINAYVSESDATTLDAQPDGQPHQVMLSPISWGLMTHLVTLQIERIINARDRDLQASPPDKNISVMDVVWR